MLRRETIIALRARHTAFRMALDILYPHTRPPELPRPVIAANDVFSEQPIDDSPDWLGPRSGRSERQQRRLLWTTRVLVWGLVVWLVSVAVVCIGALVFELTRSPPPAPPPARAISPQ